jgi:hypothetical protein
MLKSRLLAGLAPACGLLLLASAAPSLASPSEPSGAATAVWATAEEAITAPVVIATYNIRHALSNAVVVSDLERLSDAGVGVIGLQEMGSRDRRDAVREQLVDCGSCQFDAFMPNGAGPGALPILYRSSSFQLLSTGTQEVSEATYVGPSGAGPSTLGPKSLTYVQLRHLVTGQDMYVINNHAVASVQASDGGPNYEHPERLQLYRQHMDGLKAMITEFTATGAAVFTTGDFNVSYRRDSVLRPDLFPYYNMSQVDVFASYKFLGMPVEGTHVNASGTNDARLIDYVSSLSHAAVEPKAQTILTGYSSDHRPVRVRYALTGTTETPDSSAPVLSEYDFTPKQVDVNGGAKNVVVTARVTDATGANPPTLVLTSDSTTQTAGSGVMTRVAGTAADGVYKRTVSISTMAAAGSWTVSIHPLEDTLGNSDDTMHTHPQKLMVANATAPGAPTSVQAEPGERSAEVSWAPAPDNGSAVTAYTVTATPGGAQVATDGAVTSATMPSLTSGTSYTFTVQASNRMGTGPDSVSSSAVTPFAVLPRTAITSGPAKHSFVTSANATIGYSSSEPDSSFACLLDGIERSCGSSSVSLSALAQTTHSFSVAAQDGAGDVDASPATRAWTIPLDSTALTHSSGWSQRRGTEFYMGVYSQTSKQGAALRSRVSGMRKLALVVTTGPGYGAVKVYLGTRLLERVSLDSAVLTKQQVLPIQRFSSAKTGKVRVVVVSSGKPVRVEGLGVATP